MDPETGAESELFAGVFVGRAGELSASEATQNRVVLVDAPGNVSRKHLLVTDLNHLTQTVEIVDNGSTDGTQIVVSGEADLLLSSGEPAQLSHGSVVSLGGYQVELVVVA